MANKIGYSHVWVSFIYAGVQLLINGLVVYMEMKGNLSYFVILATLLLLTLIYVWKRRLVFRKITRINF
jgi:hypothetical protein